MGSILLNLLWQSATFVFAAVFALMIGLICYAAAKAIFGGYDEG